ncbi:MAG: phage tail protein [Bacteroidota bacterium]
MKQSSHPSSDFYFELSANGEQTTFKEVPGISTEVVLRNNLKEGENPFKFRLPSPPKGNLVLKHGDSQADSKLMQWVAECQNKEVPTQKSRVNLRLKDKSGNALLEWTFYNAEAVQNHSKRVSEKSKETHIDDLELKYSFYTLTKRK